MSKDGKITALSASAILLSVVSLAPIGAGAEEPRHQKKTDYPTVYMPPRPDKPAMTADEQLKLKKDLAATRDHQETMGKTTVGAGRGKPAKP